MVCATELRNVSPPWRPGSRSIIIQRGSVSSSCVFLLSPEILQSRNDSSPSCSVSGSDPGGFYGFTHYLFFTSHDFWNFHFKMFCGFCPTVMLATRDSTIFVLKLGFLNFPSRGSTCLSSESKGRKISVFKK